MILVFYLFYVQVTSAARLDYERLQQFSISIKVTDSGFPTQSYLKQFSVLIQDVNEPPKLAYLSNNEVIDDFMPSPVISIHHFGNWVFEMNLTILLASGFLK